MNVFPPLGTPSDVHEITHGRVGGGDAQMQALARVSALHLEYYAQLTARLRDTLDIDGTPLLDSTALAFCCCAASTAIASGTWLGGSCSSRPPAGKLLSRDVPGCTHG